MVKKILLRSYVIKFRKCAARGKNYFQILTRKQKSLATPDIRFMVTCLQIFVLGFPHVTNGSKGFNTSRSSTLASRRKSQCGKFIRFVKKCFTKVTYKP